MAMAMALLKAGLARESSNQRGSSSGVQTRVRGDRGREEGRARGENKMLSLHESLSTSLYRNKDRSNEKLSVKIVLLVTLFATLATGTFTHQHNPLLILLYLLTVWILPMWSYILGVKKKNSFLLVPWIFVFCVHGVVTELFILGAACETLAVYLLGGTGVSVNGSEPIIVISGTFLDFLLLVFLSIPLPILISVPVKAFVYMDINRRRKHNLQESSSCCHFVCCCMKTRQTEGVNDDSVEVSEHSDVDEENPADNSSSVQTTSMIITRFQRLNQQHNIFTTVIRERLAGTDDSNDVTEEVTNLADTTAVQQRSTDTADQGILARFPSLYDLGSIGEDVAEEAEVIPEAAETGLDSLPPSYSQAEGLDQLPSYSEVEISRMRIGPFVMVYDKEQKSILTFKK